MEILKNKLALDWIAIVLSVIAILASGYTTFSGTKRDRVSEAVDLCVQYYIGPILRRDHETIRNWRLEHQQQEAVEEADDLYSSLPIEVRVAFSHSYNLLDIALLSAERAGADRDTLLQCLGPAFETFCSEGSHIFTATRWERLEKTCPDFTRQRGRLSPRGMANNG
ncbi:hypothetical protein [Salipiger sp. CCB-MM3]|uniref:hypothetical protein n=1 Tax=Salipiger sp. CCB-MM3 TaxID=1792508 RepID=UPI0012FAE86F|nr:hypothetical protein [Salipiger sp. CCB-MM3]